MASNNSLYITYVEKEGPFLKIWGQTDNNLPTIIEKSLSQMTAQFDSGLCIPSPDNIQSGLLCCAKYKDGAYYRSRITNTSLLHQSVVEVHFIDYGNRDIISIMNLRTIGSFGPGLITIPGQAKDFILANVTHHGPGWDTETVQMITGEIRYMELAYLPVSQVGIFTLIKLFKNGEDIALSCFNRGMVLSIATSAQHVILQSMRSALSPNIYQLRSPMSPIPAMTTQVTPLTPTTPPADLLISPKNVPAPSPAPAPPALLTYKAFSLEAGAENYIYISYVSDGPCHFSVQLQKLEDTLTRLMNELNRMTLQPLEDDPIPGTVCVARCLEDQYICRAVVTSMVDGQFKVYYVDFGNTEVVPVDNLYQIPFKYVIPKVMAMRYALAGLERSSVTIEMKCAFKEFVSEKLLRMKALPPPSRSALPLCHLYDDKNVNVLEILKKAALLAYPEVAQLSRGFSQEIRVSYVFSCSHFYVQIKSKDEDLRNVMAQLQTKCPTAKPLRLSDIKVGLPCCALFNTDGQWYRAQVLSMKENIITVRYVDYGNEETVDACNLRMPPAEQVMDLRPQALECCLNGYQNMPDDLERDNILEELILESEFTMKVIEMHGNRALVDLIDGSRYNVGSLLLEKLASAKSQVSPLLIQDSHSIEPRKRKEFTFDRRSSRTDHPFRDKDDSNSFNNKPFRRDSTENSFESNSADFKPKRDGFKKDFRKFDNSKPDNFSKNAESNTWDDQNNSQWRSNDRNDKSNSHWKSNDREDKNRSQWRSNDRDDKNQWRSGDRNDKNNSQWRSNDREGSETSFADTSDNNWRRNTNNKNFNDKDKRPNRKFGGKDTDRFNKFNNNDAAVSKPLAQVTDPAPATAEFLLPDLIGKTEAVMICWFYNPSSFFCHLQHDQDQFKKIMTDIQEHYCNIEPTFASVGSPAVALYPEDGVIYRARILEVKGTQYQVQYVDFGNTASTEKVWPIENKFMQLPAQAIGCSLNGVIPTSGEWTNLDQFASYFDKDLFMCNFLSVIDNQYLVELTYNNVSVAEELTTAGLASGSVAFDPSLLLGQQIKVTLKETEGLDSFSVALPNELLLLCSLHNLSDATWKSDDALLEYIGSFIYIYVDNVLEDKTEVTLYDSSGAKLKLIEPDEGAYDKIEVLCSMPILFPTLNGWVAYLEPKEDKFIIYLHMAEYSDILVQMLDALFTHYDTTEYKTLEPNPSEFYAVHSTDGNWYRAQVVTVDQDQVNVKYVDYGNSETIPVTELRELTSDFKECHILALELLASGVDESYLECQVTANVWFAETWEAEIKKVDQIDNQASSNEEPHISEKGYDEPIQATIDTTEAATVEETEQPGVPITLSHIDSPNEFYIQLVKDSQDIAALQENLQAEVVDFPDLESTTAGGLCAAPYSLDQNWYRAQILDADADITTVRFVDFGNTDVLDNSTVHVKTLPPALLSLEQYARRCSLNVKPVDNEWSPAACERFEALTSGEVMSVEIIHQEEKTTYVNLFTSDKNVAEILVQEGLAVKMQLETESSCTGYVSHMNSPSEFWIQLENSVADLELIAEQLSTAENFPELEDLTPGSLCAARFPEDEMWYRARILSNTVGGLEVLFIDYGNSCTCTGLRQLPEELIMLPALAQKCSLQKPSGILQWCAKATEEFKNISEDGATIFNVDRISAGETSIVRLLENGIDITSKLLPQTENVFISHFESISSFWLHKEENMTALSTINETLKGAANWPVFESENTSDLVAALCSERGQWNRARINNKKDGEYDVIFIDYGDKSTVNDIRKLMDDTEIESPFAYEVKLEPLPCFYWNEESSEQFLKMFKKGVTLFQAEYVTTDLVRLYLNGRDVRMDIDAVLASSCQNTPKKAVLKDDIEDLEKADIDDSEILIIDVAHTDAQISDLEKNEDVEIEVKEESNTQINAEEAKIDNIANDEKPDTEISDKESDINELEVKPTLETQMKESTTDVDDTLLETTNVQTEKCEQNIEIKLDLLQTEHHNSELDTNEVSKDNLEEHTEVASNISSNLQKELLENEEIADIQSSNEQESKDVQLDLNISAESENGTVASNKSLNEQDSKNTSAESDSLKQDRGEDNSELETKDNLEEHTEVANNILSNSQKELLENEQVADLPELNTSAESENESVSSNKALNEEDSKNIQLELNTSAESENETVVSNKVLNEQDSNIQSELNTNAESESLKQRGEDTFQSVDGFEAKLQDTSAESVGNTSQTTEDLKDNTASESTEENLLDTDNFLEDLNLVSEPQENQKQNELNETNLNESSTSFASCDSRTSFSEKIVPGSISRGDLSEVPFSDDDTPVVKEEEHM